LQNIYPYRALHVSGGELIIERIREILVRKGLSVSTAESCTGGIISSMLTSMGGASGYFLLGCVPYTNDMKISLLGVNPDTIDRYTAVSNEVAQEMAEGVRRISGSDIGISTTGFAGPTGGDKDNPIGTVYMAIGIFDRTISQRLSLNGNRKQIISKASERALELLMKTLQQQN